MCIGMWLWQRQGGRGHSHNHCIKCCDSSQDFDHPKMDLTDGQLTNCTRRKCSAALLDRQQCWFWHRIQHDRPSVPFDPLTASWPWSHFWTWPLWEWPPLLWLWGLFFHSYQYLWFCYSSNMAKIASLMQYTYWYLIIIVSFPCVRSREKRSPTKL